MVKDIFIKSVHDILELNDIAAEQDFDLHVSSKSIKVNAKSFLGLLILLNKDVKLVAPDHVNIERFQEIINKLPKRMLKD